MPRHLAAASHAQGGRRSRWASAGLGLMRVKIGWHRVEQVTENGNPLYTFYLDTGKAVQGQGVGGFSVATVS